MKQESHEIYMRRALELARLGVGDVSPNPAVGSVIVHNGKIIGEGWHKKYGTAHAEVNAINSVADKALLSESIIYVTLEPCAHWGKTPPCCDLIISHHIPRVVIGTIDPFKQVDGEGIRRMKENGIEVIAGVLQSECQALNAPFFTTHTKNRPYITLKWAQTADGYMDIIRTPQMAAKWFTGESCRTIVHRLRAQNDAIMVGHQTVIMDNPSLTTRSYFGKNPTRITFDRNLTLPPTASIFDNQAPTLLFTSRESLIRAQEKFADTPNITPLPLDYDIPTTYQILDHLYHANKQSLIVEGGPTLLGSFISNKLYDQIIIFQSPLTLDQIHNTTNTKGVKAPHVENQIKEEISSEKFGCKILIL